VLAHAALAVGIAEGAIMDFVELAETGVKVARSGGWGVARCYRAKRLAQRLPRSCGPRALLPTRVRSKVMQSSGAA